MNIKKKLLILSSTGVLGIGLVIGGATFALFTSSASNTNNSAHAGTVIIDIERDQGDSIPGPMFYTSTSDPTGKFPYDIRKNQYAPPGSESLGGMAPGDKMTRALNIYNKGSLDVVVKRLKATVNPLGITSGSAYEQFIQKLNVKVMYPAQDKVLYDGKLSGLLNGEVGISPFLIATAPSGAANITFTVELDKSADNLIQGQTFVFDFRFYAEQERNN
ncbi:hypothetical protein [Bacillus sp. FJAT-29814]|uniref:hypothetical protein n=1 Tax=Bacillus sp. FJAT-29814 TaxID=1729688 RepID=UPI00083212A7|nr:hypothetical protein [Bacillus sp. FJAT-29814]